MQNSCSDCFCYCKSTYCPLNTKEIVQMLRKADSKLLQLSKTNINTYNWDTGCYTEIPEIGIYVDTLKRYINQIVRTGKSCICPETVATIYKKLTAIVGKIKDSTTEEINRDKEADWIRENPMCATKEKWKILAYKICRELEIEITIEEILCNYTLDITLNNITCDVLTVLSAANIDCKNNTTVTVKEEDCKIEHQLLIEKHPNGPELSLYNLALKRHGLSYDKIKLIYDNGLTLGLNKLGNCTLNTVIDSYDLTEITYNKVITEIP